MPIYNNELKKGSTYRLIFTIKPDGETPLDLTGYTAEMRIAEGYGGSHLLTASTANDQVTLGGVDGTVSILIPASDTDTINEGLAQVVYQVDLNKDGLIETVLEGFLNLNKKVPSE